MWHLLSLWEYENILKERMYTWKRVAFLHCHVPSEICHNLGVHKFQMTSRHGNHAVASNQLAGNKTITGMGPICTHRAIAKHAGIVWLDRKTIMAPATSAIVKEAKKQTCILVKEDVLSVVLTRESVEQCSAVQPKRWLTCRGAKTSRKHFFFCPPKRSQDGLRSLYGRI